MRVPVVFAVVFWLAAGIANPASGQETPTYTIVPWAGVFLPTSDLASEQNIEQPVSGLPATVTLSQQTGPAFGLRGSRSLTARLAVELEAFLSLSEIELTGVRPGIGPLTEPSRDAYVLVIGADIMYEIFRAPFTPFAVHVLGGAGVVIRGGDFFDEEGGFFSGMIDGGTSIAGVAGAGFRYGLSSRFGLRLDVRDYISSYSQTIDGQDLDSELQNDVVISGGLEFTL